MFPTTPAFRLLLVYIVLKYFVAESVLPSMCHNRSEHSLTHHKITLAKTPELHWVTLAQTCNYHRHRRHLAAQITRLFGTDMTVLCFCENLCDAKNEQAKYWRHIRCINAVKSYKTSRSGATVSAISARLTTVTLAGWCTVFIVSTMYLASILLPIACLVNQRSQLSR